MPDFRACALVALVFVSLTAVSITAHAARNDRILLILPESGEWRDEVLAYWNDGVGLEVDMVVDPELGVSRAGPEAGMLASFDAPVVGADWLILRVSEPGELPGRLDALGPDAGPFMAMGPTDAFSDTPAEVYQQLEGVIITTPALPDDGDRAAFLSRARVVATQANAAKPGILFGISLVPAHGDENPLLPAHKLFEDTRDFAGIFAVDTATLGAEGIALVDSVATAAAPRSGGMYMDMMQRPANVLDPTKEIWMQRGAMVLGVLTILGVILIVRFKRPPDHTPPKAG